MKYFRCVMILVSRCTFNTARPLTNGAFPNGRFGVKTGGAESRDASPQLPLSKRPFHNKEPAGVRSQTSATRATEKAMGFENSEGFPEMPRAGACWRRTRVCPEGRTRCCILSTNRGKISLELGPCTGSL